MMSLHQVALSLLQQGSVFYYADPSIPSREPHNCVLLNPQPQREDRLLFVSSTSKVDKTRALRRAMPPETLVFVTPAEYPDFTVPSLFDCNMVMPHSFLELVRFLQKVGGSVKVRDRMSDQVIQRLIRGIKMSPVVEPWIKEELDLSY